MQTSSPIICYIHAVTYPMSTKPNRKKKINTKCVRLKVKTIFEQKFHIPGIYIQSILNYCSKELLTVYLYHIEIYLAPFSCKPYFYQTPMCVVLVQKDFSILIDTFEASHSFKLQSCWWIHHYLLIRLAILRKAFILLATQILLS